MNILSLFLYLSDVVYTQVNFLIFLNTVLPSLYVLYRLACKLWADTVWSYDGEAIRERKLVEQGKPLFDNWKFIYLPVVVLFFLNFVPSKETLYLIAGSEAGEYVVNTPEAKAILSDIQEVIQLQIQQLKPNDSPTTN